MIHPAWCVNHPLWKIKEVLLLILLAIFIYLFIFKLVCYLNRVSNRKQFLFTLAVKVLKNIYSFYVIFLINKYFIYLKSLTESLNKLNTKMVNLRCY